MNRATKPSNAIRLEDASELVVGEVYQVHCVFWRNIWMPVIAGWHCESELGDYHRHIHFDVRFLDNKRLKRLNIYSESAIRYNYNRLGIMEDAEGLKAEDIEYQPLKCKRLETYSQQRPHKDIEELVKDRIVGDCKRCPHRGTDLQHLTPDKNGVIICPAHGVRWDAETGRQVKWTFDMLPKEDQ